MTPKQFIEKQYRWSGFKERIEPYLTDKKCSKKLQEYVLSEDMKDTAIQIQCKSEPIPVKIFASIFQNFCKTANKENYYVFHLKTPKEVLAVRLGWGGDGWGLDGCDFDGIGPWLQGRVFLFFATGTLETESSPLALESLDTSVTDAITLLKSRGYKVSREF